MAINSFFIEENIKAHIKRNSMSYFITCVVLLIGLIIGVVLSVTGYKYTSLLTSADKNMFDYITGEAEYSSIFYSRFGNTLLSLLILIVLSLSIYSSVLSFLHSSSKSVTISPKKT